MAVREYEAIAIGPDRILRVEAQDAIPDRIDQRRERHRRAGVSGFGLLDSVDRERADGVDAQLIKFRVCQSVHSSCHAHGRLLSLLAFVSSDATLARRRRCRSARLNPAARNASTRSQARNGPKVRAPRQIMFMSSSSTPCLAEK